MKISIIGYSGAGKSTLAKKLKAIYQIDVLHLDRVNFVADWQERDLNESERIVNDFMLKSDWIIEGNYQKLYQDRRFELSDVIIFMDFSRFICLPRAYLRYLNNRNKIRDDVGIGCKEKFDWSFFWWIVYQGRTKKFRQRYQDIINRYPDKVVILKNSKDVANYLTNLNKQINPCL